MAWIEVGETVHLIERRFFSEDVRRHFVGTVVGSSEQALRLLGYLFVFDTSSGKFLKKPESRTRIVGLDNRVIFNVLPASIEIDELRYLHDEEGNLCLADGRGFELDISEFSPKE